MRVIRITVLFAQIFVPILLCAQQGRVASDYFPFTKQKRYHYTGVGKNQDGTRPTRSLKCVLVKDDIGYFSETTQWGMVWSDVYERTDEAIFITRTKNEIGMGGDLDPPKPILRLPTGEEELKWTWGEVAFSSAYLSLVRTEKQAYQDCVVVTESATAETEARLNQKFGLTKKYYAKGYGLVKIEFFDTDGTIVENMSFELHWTE